MNGRVFALGSLCLAVLALAGCGDSDPFTFPSLGGTYEDCRDRAYAESVVRAYMTRYVPEAWRDSDAEVIARTHNGGPRGARKSATLDYWRRVEEELRRWDERAAEPR